MVMWDVQYINFRLTETSGFNTLHISRQYIMFSLKLETISESLEVGIRGVYLEINVPWFPFVVQLFICCCVMVVCPKYVSLGLHVNS